MQVVTPGLVAGEGFYGPSTLFGSPQTGAISAYFWGETGEIQVSAVANPGGQVLSSVILELTPTWPRAVLDALSIPADAELYILVQTTSAEVLTFYVDAVQYEPVSPANPYIDGDSYGCQWIGTPGLSSSEALAENPIFPVGGVYAEGTINIVVPGTTSVITYVTGFTTAAGSITITVVAPLCAMDDFAMYEAGDPDPAMTYVGMNNAGTSSGESTYKRIWGIFYPPVDYPVSSGANLWNRAAYMALGFGFTGIPAGAAANVTQVQAEICPLDGTADTAPAPSAYDTPRAVHVSVTPTRLNYCPNPSAEVSASGWQALGNAWVGQSTAQHYLITEQWDGQQLSNNDSSIIVETYSLSDGAEIEITDLFAGDTFIASGYIWCQNPSMTGVELVFPDGSGTVLDSGVDTSDPSGWLRPWVVFQANASVVNLGWMPLGYYGTFWIDDVLVENGSVLGTYFDGNFASPDYMWEANGTAGLSRSYYYESYALKQAVVDTIISQHVPVGIQAAAPVYLVPPTN